jgi:cytochrome c553
MRFGWILFLAGAVSAGTSFAGDAAKGGQKAAVCAACHGMTGSSVNPQWPSLAGQHEGYIAVQLDQFKKGSRVDPQMTPMAVGLSEADMQDLGAHFAQQTPTGLEADPSIWKAGIGCHGPEGKGNAPAKYPALRAQHAVYAYKQLKDFAEGRRTSTGNDIMRYVATKLTDEEMRALASYLQGLR